jgi:glycosyltransferase involved in cell wall biosynthesis
MPAYNEASGIAMFLEEICTSFRSEGWEPVIGVVNDCSSDQTVQAIMRFAEHSPCPVTFVSNEVNLGHGPSSVRAWHLGTSFDTEIVLHVDGDGQFHADDMLRIVSACESADGALGVRAKRSDPWFRRIVTWSLRRYVRVLSGHAITDANSPLRAYRTQALHRLLGSLPDAPIVPSVYLAAAGMTESLSIVEVDVVSYERRGESATGSTWGDARVAFLPSRRLVLFVWRAVGESARVLRRIRAQRMPEGHV